jgi:hypothetical protein
MFYYINKKYLNNFKRHRSNIFLQNKIKYNTDNIIKKNNNEMFFDVLKFRKKKKKKILYPINDNNLNISNLYLLNNNKFNDNKVFDFFKSINLINKIDFSFFVEFFLKIFRYSYFIKFFFEIILILVLLYYLFHKGTFY